MSANVSELSANDKINQSSSSKAQADAAAMQTLLRHAIEEQLPDKENALHQCAAHHFKRHGKLLRGLLAYNVARQLGVDSDPSMKWAVAIELMHNASLVHDDICDGDKLRRGHSAVWAVYGTPMALCLGDWLLSRSFALADTAARAVGAHGTVSILADTMSDLSAGQAMEFQSLTYPNWDRYQKIVLGKTTPLLRACVEGALHLANGAIDENTGNFKGMLHALGLAYQIANDIEDILATDGSSHEEGDLMRAAPNAVIILYRSMLRPARLAAFDRWLKNPEPENLSFWQSAILASGVLGSASDHVQILIDRADQELRGLHPDLQPHLRPIFTYLTAACSQAIASGRRLEAAQ